MSSLQALQQRMLHAVLAGKAPVQLQDIQGDARVDVQDRLHVYRHGYRQRLRDALTSEFPGLHCLAGRHAASLLDRYIEAHPSLYYNIRWHGAGLATFLDHAQPWLVQPEFSDIARLDWAISTAFDAADEACLAVESLAQVPPEAWANLILQPQANLKILALRCNADVFRRAADRGEKRPHLRRYAQPRHLLVWRQALSVHYRWLAEDEYKLLSGAMQGETIASLCERITNDDAPETAIRRLATCLHSWLESGLIQRWTVN